MCVRVLVDEAKLLARQRIEPRDIGRPWIDDGPFDQTTLGQFLEMRIALARAGQPAGKTGTGNRDRGINDGIALLADAFDNAGIGLPVVALAPGAVVIGMQMDD